ncbi:MAG TPA: AbrB/MazE/SpoVT family DNA-binding domain-containing protein [Flavisolibacter sp.]|nr:AbrB/MazE/SpoVT family DNA-binding domain-containing protein [Flavisolibacter sp.]
METSIVTTKGQVLIPKRLRNKYGIKAGVKVAFMESKEGIILKAMDEAYFDQFAGLLKDSLPTIKEYRTWKGEEKAKEETRIDKKLGATAKKGK